MAVRPEMIGDVEAGDPAAQVTDDMGLTPDERAAWDQMESEAKSAPAEEPEGEPEPETPDPASVEAAAKPEGEAAPEVEDEPDDAPAPAVDPKTGKPPQKHVNWNKHQRLLAQRDAKLAAAEAKLLEQSQASETERINNAKLAERLAILNEALTAAPPVDPAVAQQQAVAANPMLEPDIAVEDDALGAIAQLQRRNAYLLQQTTQTHEETKATLEDRQLKDDFQRDAEMFGRTEEGQHFGQAYQFLKDSRLTELAISLFDKDPRDPKEIFTQAEINRLVNDFNAEEKWVVANARKAGKSPSAAIMKLAKGRGYTPKAAEATPVAQVPAVPAKNGNGGIPEVVPSAVAKILAETEGAAASRSLSEGGGAPPIEPLTAERLLKMPEAEFAKYVDNLPKEHLDALMGKPAARHVA